MLTEMSLPLANESSLHPLFPSLPRNLGCVWVWNVKWSLELSSCYHKHSRLPAIISASHLHPSPYQFIYPISFHFLHHLLFLWDLSLRVIGVAESCDRFCSKDSWQSHTVFCSATTVFVWLLVTFHLFSLLLSATHHLHTPGIGEVRKAYRMSIG